MLGPCRKIVGIERELPLQSFDNRGVLEEEHRTVSGGEAPVDFLFGAGEGLRRDDGLQGLFDDAPQGRMVVVQQQHQPRGLRVESRRRMFYGEAHDPFDFGVGNRGSGFERVVTPALFERLFQFSFHDFQVCFSANLIHLRDFCAESVAEVLSLPL